MRERKRRIINDLKLIFPLDISGTGTRIDTNQNLFQRVKFHAASNELH